VIGAAARRAIRRRSLVAAVGLAIVALAAVTLTGCVSLTPDPQPTLTGRADPGLVEPLVPLTVRAVLEDCPSVDAVHYQGYALPVDRVYICRGDGHHGSDGVSTTGPWESAALVVNPAALLTAYSAPDARRSRGFCSTIDADPLIIWVRHEAVTTAYYAPVDGCGNPTAASSAAYNAAKLDTLIDIDRGSLANIDEDRPHMTDRKDH
jgi:hypothetical protein